MTSKHTTATVDWDPSTDSVSATILEAVATAKDIDPLQISTPLYDVVDPDALDRLFENTSRHTDRRGGRLTFRYEDCTITVDSEGTITARPEVAASSERPDAPPAIGTGVGQ